MTRTLLFAIGGLLLAGVIHISVVLLVPSYASQDAWAQMRQYGRDGEFHVLPLPEPGVEPLASLDPRMLHAVCRFGLASGPVRIVAQLPDGFWSVAVFDRRGRNVYSLNDRSAERSAIDLAIITPVQMAQLRQDPPASIETAIVLEVAMDEGFVLLRSFVADESLTAGATAALAAADCSADL
jgi:uncharacterized membrane protein